MGSEIFTIQNLYSAICNLFLDSWNNWLKIYIFKEFLQWHVKKTLTFPQRENVYSKFKKSFTHILKPKIGTAQSILRYETIVFGKIPIFPLEYNSAIKNRAYRYLWGSLYFLRDRNVISTSPLSKKNIKLNSLFCISY